MTLPADVARCPGYEADGEWRDGCEDCLRRTDRSAFPLQVWMEPPPVIVFECEARIAPNSELSRPTVATYPHPLLTPPPPAGDT